MAINFANGKEAKDFQALLLFFQRQIIVTFITIKLHI
jgi:hypothetical protein